MTCTHLLICCILLHEILSGIDISVTSPMACQAEKVFLHDMYNICRSKQCILCKGQIAPWSPATVKEHCTWSFLVRPRSMTHCLKQCVHGIVWHKEDGHLLFLLACGLFGMVCRTPMQSCGRRSSLMSSGVWRSGMLKKTTSPSLPTAREGLQAGVHSHC